MMLYRIVMRRYLASTWTGYGAEIYGGRWNHKGHAALYLASSVSLAMLETLVHIQDSSTLSEFELFQIEIDDSHIMLLQQSDWPTDWRSDPAPAATMDLGTEWLESASSVGLLVPSTLVPSENNMLVNPHHKDFSLCLSSVKPLSFSFDPRLK
ncbi:RES family NAD+ phosphorylase [Yersinia aleksiciae]|uniref:RES domain-containing protein n=1 Tax=Yersinia aleksiciae TaxID=263819 RepID=A0A0T9T6D5_YERAE|nr:RES family NAD+ phosphorylase [Yersinia aleksiciae]MDA5498236.1 RES family NAD+ phosphorylase [Yersinia aleksiciae]MDN0122881.1 RES family NAD+ phosphorylase [Yersinia aleksiciae]NIL01179.1 RES family NAD+ phosphorylase [Yersinia aleksiciae]WQC72656.1 RES family NAD+ phosphorylase [Yersinia aleksiciae]CFQ45102.1 RES domain-containing protein [Yersinia aleksiciae]